MRHDRDKLALVGLMVASCFQFAIAAEDNAQILEKARFAMTKNDQATARILLEPLVQKGDAAAQNLFGDLTSLSGDQALALSYYRKAAEQGNAKAQNNLGMAYVKGEGVKPDDAEGVKWLRKAAEQGHAKAENNLSVMYSTGRGVAKSDIDAAKWCQRAAEHGDVTAQQNLAMRYRNGKGVEKNEKESLKWLRKAAEQGNGLSEFVLAETLENDPGATNDKSEAQHLYRRAAAHGYAPAVFKMLLLLSEEKQLEQGVIVLKAGKKTSIKFDVVDGQLVHAHKIAPRADADSSAPGEAQSVDLSLSYDKKGDFSMLHFKSNFREELSYICAVQVPGTKMIEPTNVLPIRSGLAAFESWPKQVEQLIVMNVRVAKKEK